MSETSPSLAEVLRFVNSFYKQCQNMVRDTVRLLGDNRQIYLTHNRAWDYSKKPNDRFLENEYFSVRRSWLIFLPSSDIQRAALFHFDFYHPRRPVEPALMYGALYPGAASFDSVDKWASFYAIDDLEKSEQKVAVSHDGPITLVRGEMPKRFEEATLVRVPLETISDQAALERIVVNPLAALLQGSISEAKTCLEGVTIEPWPSPQSDTNDEEEDESERP